MAGYRHASIVLLGSFNPAIFQPEWFRANDILPASEIDVVLEGKNRLILTNDATIVRFESLVLEVLQNRWSLATDRLDWRNDLGPITGSIFERLVHTPIGVVGMNVVEHKLVNNANLQETLGRWLPLNQLADLVGTEHHVGGTVRAKWEEFNVSLMLEPSMKIPQAVYISQNYEYQLKKGTGALSQFLKNKWNNVLSRADELIKVIVEGANHDQSTTTNE
jgi:hypothetical protein